MSNDLIVASLAVEHWKLIRSVERSLQFLPQDMQGRLSAQARYAAGRLQTILGQARMQLVSFDGAVFEVNLPATAINAEDMAEADNLVVELTIEPAIVSDMTVILMGKVMLARAS